MRFWLERTATALQTQREQSTSSTWERGDTTHGHTCTHLHTRVHASPPPPPKEGTPPHFVVAPVLVQEGDDGLDVVLLDDVEDLGALDQDTVQHLQDTCGRDPSPCQGPQTHMRVPSPIGGSLHP